MQYRPVLVTAAVATPISAAEAKSHMRVDHSDDDTLITNLIAAATSYLDGWTGILGRCLVNQTWRQDFNTFSRCLPLPLFPISSVTAVKYDDEDNVEQTVSSSDYDLLTSEIGSYIRFKDDYAFPAIDDDPCSVRVTFVAGHGAAGSDVPQAIRQAMLLLVAHWYENKEAVVVGVTPVALPMAVDALLTPFRRVKF